MGQTQTPLFRFVDIHGQEILADSIVCRPVEIQPDEPNAHRVDYVLDGVRNTAWVSQEIYNGLHFSQIKILEEVNRAADAHE